MVRELTPTNIQYDRFDGYWSIFNVCTTTLPNPAGIASVLVTIRLGPHRNIVVKMVVSNPGTMLRNASIHGRGDFFYESFAFYGQFGRMVDGLYF